MKKNEPYLQMPVKETFLYGRLISGKSLGDVIYIKARRKYCFRLLLVFESGDVKMVQRTTSSNKQLARQEGMRPSWKSQTAVSSLFLIP